MSIQLKNFINDNIDLINENSKESWEEIYKQLRYSPYSWELTGEFTKIILDAGINDPALILGYIPKVYLYKSTIKDYKIPDNVTSIGEDALNGCRSLTSIQIPDNVTSIDQGAFSWCDKLTSIIIGESVNNIGYCAFNSCSSLTSVEIPDSVTSIGARSFWRCDNLKSVIIGNSAKSINESAFQDCVNLEMVVIPDSVMSIDLDAFYNCPSLKEIQYKGTKKQAIKCGIGNKSKNRWRRGSAIEKIICSDGVIEL